MADNEKNQLDDNTESDYENKADLEKDTAEGEQAEGEQAESTAEENEDTYSSQFGELEDYVDDYNSEDFNGEVAEDAMPVKKKKIKTKKLITIIVIVVVVLALLGVGAYFVFFNNSIKGTWKISQESMASSGSSVEIYYEYSDNQLIMSTSNDYAKQEEVYSISYDDGKYSFLQNGQVLQTYTYSITGNLIQGKKAILIPEGADSSSSIVLDYVPFKQETELKGPEFKKNDSIVGYWKVVYEEYGMEMYMEFTDDGIVNQYNVSPIYTATRISKYNFTGKELVMLSSGTQDASGNIVDAGKEDKINATVKDNKLTLSDDNGNSNVYEKSSKEEFEKYKKAMQDGTYKAPKSNESAQQPATETASSTAEGTTQQSATEAETASSTAEGTTQQSATETSQSTQASTQAE